MMTFEELAACLRESNRIVVFTGAGISTESGIPDFRSPGGLWTRYRPITFQEYVSSEEARLESWRRRLESYRTYREAVPNLGHHFVRSLEAKGKLMGVITQNVDGLHRMAGLPDEKIVELHGTYRRTVCLACGKDFETDEIMRRLTADFRSPTCDACGGILKPATISFGQAMPQDAMERARRWTERADTFVVMGSSLQVQPAASFPLLAKRSGARLAIVNREAGPLDELADFVHHGEIGEFCRRLIASISDG
ncbi:MAG TPA: Sir2 family NAD-dependent protein deacetylase [candidate division Zixibacteria bacterium]|nr:Sir2 family NAD-dependent protein deacetylase [candidate division Zixibacteria bacterium]